MKSLTMLCLCISVTICTSASADIIIDDFSTLFGASNYELQVFGDQPFDEWTDTAPGGAIGDRREWLEGWDWHYPGVPNSLYISQGNWDNPFTLGFGAFDYNLQWGLEYGGPTAPLNLDLSFENAFSIDLMYSDMGNSPEMTVTVVSASGEGSYTIGCPEWSDLDNPLELLFPIVLFSGTPDWSDIDEIHLHFITEGEFGPDAMFDNFKIILSTVATERATWSQVKELYR